MYFGFFTFSYNQNSSDLIVLVLLFDTRPEWFWDPYSFLYNEYWVPFLALSARGVALSSGEVKENAELYLSHICAFIACYRYKFTLLPPY